MKRENNNMIDFVRATFKASLAYWQVHINSNDTFVNRYGKGKGKEN